MTNTLGSVGFFTPYYQENRGNATTAKRMEYGLKQKGLHVEMFAHEEEEWTEEAKERLEACDVYHILHFFRFADWSSEIPNRPYIITNGGTDVNHHLFESEQDRISRVKTLVDGAEALAVFSEDGKSKTIKALGLSSEKVHVIPQSVWVPEGSSTKKPEMPKGCPRFLLPAGLRPVKDVLFLLDELAELRETFRELQFVLIGSVLDDKVYRKVQMAEQQYEWFHYGGEVPLAEMKTWYDWADVVLNTSVSEGQSSALLEAMALGKLVAARENPGNESVVSNGDNGFLYHSGEEFL
ncbi:MAG TPA: glycosyltransferase [Bacillales bacterium]|nr:glycosyltransferase [Bacillales bacterium]